MTHEQREIIRKQIDALIRERLGVAESSARTGARLTKTPRRVKVKS